jgi:hypothetical protein
MPSFLLSIFKSSLTYIFVSLLLLLVFSLRVIQPSFSDFTLTTPLGTTQATEFPFFAASTEAGVYRLHGFMEMGKFTNPIMRIIPDDEILGLVINQQTVDLNMIPISARRDYSKGFVYDLSPYLNTGKNEVEILYRDGGGLMGIIMSAEGSKLFDALIYLVLFGIALTLTAALLKPMKIKPSIKLLFVGALLIRLAYFTVTPPDVRDHDMGDHIGYTEYLTTHWMPPPVEFAVGGAFFHPPLYYYTGALVYKATQWVVPFNKVQIYRVQQLLSLVYSMGFVLFGLLILNELLSLYRKSEEAETSAIKHETSTLADTTQLETTPLESDENKEPQTTEPTKKPKQTWLTLSYWCSLYKTQSLFWVVGVLFAFWPSAIIHSTRIGNDPLLYCLLAASLYYIVRWFRSDLKRDLLIASILTALTIVTKANGEILIPVIGIIGLYKMIKSRQWLDYIKLAIAPCLIILVAVAITIGPGLILKMEGKRDKLYIDNIDGLSTANLVGNTASNYFWFDAKIFITEPYTDPYDDRMGRQFFWNYLGKTGLFGEFKYPGALSINTAVVMSFLAFLMIIYTLMGIYHMTKEDFKRSAPILLSGFFLWAGVTYMRMTFPANIDFRYIVPILITFCGLFAISTLNYRRIGANRLANIGLAIASLFSFCSIIFILALL